MSTLNFNVSGDPKGDQPVIIADNPPGGTQLASHFEGVPGSAPNRFVVTVPPDITGGASLYYQNRSKWLRVIVPPGEGSWEASDPPCRPPEYPPDFDVSLKYAHVTQARTGLVSFVGRATVDAGGLYYPLGDTLLYALGHWHRGDAGLVQENAAYIQSFRHDYVRWLGCVNWSNDVNPEWPEYETNAADLIDFLYDVCGLRSKITVTGGGSNAHLAARRLKPVIASGRQHKIQMIEAVNEQNDSASTAIWIAQYMRDLGVPVATGRGNTGITTIRDEGNAAGASLDCFHTERGLGAASEPGGPHARQIRQGWDFKEFNRPVENGEPPGLTSSVATLDDPFQIAMNRATSIICGAGHYCDHSGHGVYGVDYSSAYGQRYARFVDAPNMSAQMAAVRNADAHLPLGPIGILGVGRESGH